MTDQDPQTAPLREWNRLARENAENAIVSSMFEASLLASKPIETFSTWLMVAAAAVASFFITNADSLIPLLGRRGFLTCGLFLAASCLFGLGSRMHALRCNIQTEVSAAVGRTFLEHLATYKREEQKIREGAKFWGITLETGVRLDRILAEFCAPLPRVLVWFARRHWTKHAKNPQIRYLQPVSAVQWQGIYAALQALAFLAFIVGGIVSAAAT